MIKTSGYCGTAVTISKGVNIIQLEKLILKYQASIGLATHSTHSI